MEFEAQGKKKNQKEQWMMAEALDDSKEKDLVDMQDDDTKEIVDEQKVADSVVENY